MLHTTLSFFLFRGSSLGTRGLIAEQAAALVELLLSPEEGRVNGWLSLLDLVKSVSNQLSFGIVSGVDFHFVSSSLH